MDLNKAVPSWHIPRYIRTCDMNCGSAFEPDASGLPYYCTSICVSSWCTWRASCVDSNPGKKIWRRKSWSREKVQQEDAESSKTGCRKPSRGRVSKTPRPWGRARRTQELTVHVHLGLVLPFLEPLRCGSSGTIFPQFSLYYNQCWTVFVFVISNVTGSHLRSVECADFFSSNFSPKIFTKNKNKTSGKNTIIEKKVFSSSQAGYFRDSANHMSKCLQWSTTAMPAASCAQLPLGGAILLIGSKITPLNICGTDLKIELLTWISSFHHPPSIILAINTKWGNAPFQTYCFPMRVGNPPSDVIGRRRRIHV